MDNTIYDADYYERGIESGKSCYTNYRWQAELTIPMAMTMIDYLGIKRGQTVLDFGCAKGYLVKAFRLLHRYAYGIDKSEYALEHADQDVKMFCKKHLGHSIFPAWFDFCIAKDVFEHISEEDIPGVLKKLKIDTESHRRHPVCLFAIVPLGDEDGFYAPANNMDITHITCKDADWWEATFVKAGWVLKEFAYKVPGIKDSYYPKYPEAHGFFVLQNNK